MFYQVLPASHPHWLIVSPQEIKIYQRCTHSIAFYELMWYITSGFCRKSSHHMSYLPSLILPTAHDALRNGAIPDIWPCEVLPWTMRWTQWPWLTRPCSRSPATQGCRVDTGSDPPWTSPAPAPWRWRGTWREPLLNNAKFTRECPRDIEFMIID